MILPVHRSCLAFQADGETAIEENLAHRITVRSANKRLADEVAASVRNINQRALISHREVRVRIAHRHIPNIMAQRSWSNVLAVRVHRRRTVYRCRGIISIRTIIKLPLLLIIIIAGYRAGAPESDDVCRWCLSCLSSRHQSSCLRSQ